MLHRTKKSECVDKNVFEISFLLSRFNHLYSDDDDDDDGRAQTNSLTKFTCFILFSVCIKSVYVVIFRDLSSTHSII